MDARPSKAQDQHDALVFGFSQLEVLFGHQNAEQVRIPYREIRTPGVERSRHCAWNGRHQVD